MRRIHLISGPRNISTALMYSFAQRKDTVVIDEPFYGFYLTHSGPDHPGREEILSSMRSSPEKVIEEVVFKEYDRELVFLKNMAKHLSGFDYSFYEELENVFLIRDPVRLITSFAKVVPEIEESELGLKHEYALFKRLKEKGKNPIVLNSDILLRNPPLILARLCAALHIPYDENMLSWKAGARPEDGIWAPYWYANVHRSAGFQPYQPPSEEFPGQYRPLLEEVQPYFNYLNQFAIKPSEHASEI